MSHAAAGLVPPGPAAPFPLLAPPAEGLRPACRAFLDQLLGLRLVSPMAAWHFLDEHGDHLDEFATPVELASALVAAGLLTDLQVNRILIGKTHGLVLGNYRILERLGAGGMGTVYLAEHLFMGRRAALKVLPVDDDCPVVVRERFYAEMRVLAGLDHPHVVLALDAGEVPSPAPNEHPLIYLAMELVPGGDLEGYVAEHGPCPLVQACEWIRQAASGLQEAHDHHLVHRDIKPSNLLVDENGRVKLVDFGLARQFSSRLTDPRVLLGSVEFMAPEQSHDPSGVGPAADVYGLGATLFWLLTGEPPYTVRPTVGEALKALQEEPPRRLRQLRPDAPPELEALLDSLLARDPARRPAQALHVMNALGPHALAGSRDGVVPRDPPGEADRLAEQLLVTNRQLEKSLAARAADVRRAQDALLFAMARMAESRDGETPGHLRRLQCYARALAEAAAARFPEWGGLVDGRFLVQLDRCMPLHDIGKIGLPDDVLLKPGPLDPLERALVETHPLIGDRMLEALAREYGQSLDFLGTARAIVRHHHERYDGQGYPDRLAGDAIPAAARLAAVADVYDALRRERLYKPAQSHEEASQVLVEEAGLQFDPQLIEAFVDCHEEFERTYDEIRE
jgi:Protein kinase domain/HD domain